MKIKKLFSIVRNRLFPSQRQKILNKWFRDNGDNTLRINYNLIPASFVMDIGGYKGDWTNKIYHKYTCHIAVFKPVKAYADGIRERFKAQDNIHVYNYALGKTNRKDHIRISGDSSSIFKNAGKQEEMIVKDVKEWFDEFRIESVALMKINIEGGEYELLERMLETGLINKLENIQIQFHNINSDSSHKMQTMQEELKKTHFLTYQYPFVWENWQKKK